MPLPAEPKLSALAGGQPPAEFGRFVHAEVQRWSKVVKEANVKIDN